MRFIKAIAALVAMVALIVGVPWLLIVSVGNPWPPEGIPLQAPLTPNAVAGILAVLIWLIWAQIMVAFGAELVNLVRRGDRAIELPGVSHWQQRMASAMVWAVAAGIVGATVSTMGTAAPAAAQQTTVTATSAALIQNTAATDPAPETEPQQTQRAEEESPTLTVQLGDSLWSLAEQHLGDGARYKDIAALNEGHTMADGSTFASAGAIQPGWTLNMPADAQGLDPRSADAEGVHVVQAGDTLSDIAAEELGDAQVWPEVWKESQDLAQPQPLSADPNLIFPGQRIKIPGASTPVPAPNTNTEPAPSQPPAPRAEVEPKPAPVSSVPAPAAVDAESPAQGEATTSEGSEGSQASDDSSAPWVLPVIAGVSGLFLAGGTLVMMRQRRASRERSRRPGFVMSPPPQGTARMESSIRHVGHDATAAVELVDSELRLLAAGVVGRGDVLPPIAAVEVTERAIAVHLCEPAPAPGVESWVASSDELIWLRDRPQTPSPRPAGPSPWPMLVTIGHDAAGSTWMLNLENLDVRLRGDRERTEAFARFIVAQLACNPWSEDTTIDLLGVGEELAAVCPDRINVHSAADAVTLAGLREATETVERLGRYGVDAPTARARQEDADLWPTRAIVIDAASDDVASDVQTFLAQQPSAVGLSLVLNDHSPSGGGLAIAIDERGQLRIAAVDLDLVAVGLSSDEAMAIAALLDHAESVQDVKPEPLKGEKPWQQFVDVTGALQDQYTASRETTTASPSTSILPKPSSGYTEVGSTTAADLQEIAPKVTAEVAEKVLAADPGLDAELAAWHSDATSRPKLALLGQVTATTTGRALEKRRPYYTELLAWIATRPYGSTTDETADAMGITADRVRKDVAVLRGWLGHDRNGVDFLPKATDAPGAKHRGVGVYEVPDALVDLDLVRRLRARGQARQDGHGIDDYWEALRLVSDRPFSGQRDGGWKWLVEGERLDHVAVVMIVDMAHTLVSHHLGQGEIDKAQAAVGIALMVDPDAEIPLLDLAAIASAEGKHQQAADLVDTQVCNRSDDGAAPVDLSDRTRAIIAGKDWLTKAG